MGQLLHKLKTFKVRKAILEKDSCSQSQKWCLQIASPKTWQTFEIYAKKMTEIINKWSKLLATNILLID